MNQPGCTASSGAKRNDQPIIHDYFYGSEAEQYIFFRFPKALITNKAYKPLSDGTKILYGLMLDRMSLSLKNGWLDENKRAYIYFTLEAVQEQMNCGHNKGVKMMSELENIGLIERIKQGLGKPAIIYVKKFSVGAERGNAPLESYPQTDTQGNTEFPKLEVQTSDKGKSRVPHTGSADFRLEDTNKTELNNTESSNTDSIPSYQQGYEESLPPIFNQDPDKDRIREMEIYREIVRDNIEYDILADRYGTERVNEVVELITDTICSKRQSICIASDEFPRAVVKSRLLKLTSSHILYVFGCIDTNTTKVRNIKKYLLAALYNAPVTMDTYYRAEVNHDLYG